MDEPLLHVGRYLSSLLGYWWPFVRIMAAFSLAPMFNHMAVSARVRVLLALALTMALAAALPESPPVNPLSLQGVALTLEQIVFGLLLGLSLQLVFVAFTIVGSVVSTPMGLSMAMMSDPVHGVSSSPLLYQLYFILLAFLFFAIDGHLVTVSVLYQSFVHWPVGGGLYYNGFSTIAYAFGWILSAAVLIAAPVVFCMLLVHFCFGLLNRISPAMNLFSLGFPIAIVSGLLLIYFTVPSLAENYLTLTRELLDSIGLMMEGAADGRAE